MDEKEGLTGERARSTVADLAEAQLSDLDSGAESIGAAAPVGDAVDATDRVGAEALDGAGGWHGSYAAEIRVVLAVVLRM